MFQITPAIQQVLEDGFESAQTLVIGDIMLDRYIFGKVNRISPEAPVPVINVTQEYVNPGGAANVAMNSSGLKVKTSVVGYVGVDRNGSELLDILKQAGINTAGIVRLEDRSTITKTRLVSNHQQLARIDREEIKPFSQENENRLLKNVMEELSRKPNVIILSDYAKGTLSKSICQFIITHARQCNIPVLVDPKGEDFSKYKGATAISPNCKELSQVTHGNPDNLEQLLEKGQQLLAELELEYVILTRSEEGISLIEDQTTQNFPAVAQDVFDVSGAGDTVISTLSAGLSLNIGIEEAISLANIAAGVVVSKVGTHPIILDELRHAVSYEETMGQARKIYGPEELRRVVEQWRAKGDRLVFTNGCFDLLHAGHVTYIEMAKKEGKRLIIGLNSDLSVRNLKGPGRPVIRQEDRARVLAALESVDAVTIFDEETPLNLILELKPDVLVKGNDYKKENVVGGKEVQNMGGQVVLIPVIEGRSTSGILGALNN